MPANAHIKCACMVLVSDSLKLLRISLNCTSPVDFLVILESDLALQIVNEFDASRATLPVTVHRMSAGHLHLNVSI